MKVTVLETAPAFKPVELLIKIESEQELLDLWHRLNAPAFWLKLPDGEKFKGNAVNELATVIDWIKESMKIEAYYPTKENADG